jgi:hypothetical protein
LATCVVPVFVAPVSNSTSDRAPHASVVSVPGLAAGPHASMSRSPAQPVRMEVSGVSEESPYVSVKHCAQPPEVTVEVATPACGPVGR